MTTIQTGIKNRGTGYFETQIQATKGEVAGSDMEQSTSRLVAQGWVNLPRMFPGG